MTRPLRSALAAASILLGSASLPIASAHAQDEAEIMRLQGLCRHGDTRACVRFGMAIEHNHDRIVEWRKMHADWFWWE